MDGEVEGGCKIRKNDIEHNLVTEMDTSDQIPPANPEQVFHLHNEMGTIEQFVPANNLAVLQIGNELDTQMDTSDQPENNKGCNVIGMDTSDQFQPANNVLLSESEQILALSNEEKLKMATDVMTDMEFELDTEMDTSD